MRKVFIATALLAACSALAPATATAVAPRWQTIPGDSHAFQKAWAADRAWMFREDDSGADVMAIRSARIGANRLGTWTSLSLPGARSYLGVLDDRLYYTLPDGTVRSVALNADGSLGTPEAVPGAPANGPPPVVAGEPVRLPDRFVWIAGEQISINAVRFYGCCTPAGNAVDYSAFLPPSVRVKDLRLGRDAAGRLWLVWITGSRAFGPVKAIELSPDTLEPIGSPIASPLPSSSSIVGMPCESSCYAVTEASGGRAYSWRPGASSVTRIPMRSRSRRGLIAVDSFGGRMLFAYWADSTEGLRIRLARGNARGANARILRTIAYATSLGFNVQATGLLHGIVDPRGAVVFQQYDNFATGRVFSRAVFLRR